MGLGAGPGLGCDEVRAHLGVETQRQWSDLALRHTTPALLGLVSLVTLFAQAFLRGQSLRCARPPGTRRAGRPSPISLAFVRQQVWPSTVFSTSPSAAEIVGIPRAVFRPAADTLAFAA